MPLNYLLLCNKRSHTKKTSPLDSRRNLKNSSKKTRKSAIITLKTKSTKEISIKLAEDNVPNNELLKSHRRNK